MATNKQSRAQQKRRYEQFQAKISARQARRRRRQRFVAIAAVVLLVLTFGAAGIWALQSDESPNPANDPALTATPTTTPTANPATTALAPAPSYAEYRTWNATIDTNKGTITATLDGAAAPQAVSSFVYLAQQGYFNGTTCHRVVNAGIYVLQCGSPDGTGSGGPGYAFGPVENAPADDQYPAGTVAMARVGGDAYSHGSQFFLVYEDSPIFSDAAGGYTVFGTITSGLAILEAIGAAGTSDGGSDGTPVEPVTINEVSVE